MAENMKLEVVKRYLFYSPNYSVTIVLFTILFIKHYSYIKIKYHNYTKLLDVFNIPFKLYV